MKANILQKKTCAMTQYARFKYGCKGREIKKEYDLSWILGVGWRIWVANELLVFKISLHSRLYS